MRVLNKNGYKEFNKTTFLYCLIWQLEKIADEYKYLCNYLIENQKVKLQKEIVNLYEEVNTLFANFYNLFYDYSKDKLMNFSNMGEELINKSMELHAISKGNNHYVMTRLSVLISKIYNLKGPFIGTLI